MATEEVNYSYPYLYERLGPQQFQRLAAAIVTHAFPHAACYPLWQGDGGRDMTAEQGNESLIFQVKWSAGRVANPVTWLKKTITQEAEDIARLVTRGATGYILITSVAGTATPGTGTMDVLAEYLAGLHARFGIPMQVWWRADVDARLDAAPAEVKWTFPDMLTGVAAWRALIGAGAADDRLRRVLVTAMAAQWREDSKIKFNQVELESASLVDLFVDVPAMRLRADPPSTPELVTDLPDPDFPDSDAEEPEDIGGAAAWLAQVAPPFTLVRGEPGQGKSTLGQYLCQQHRAAWLADVRHGAPAPDGPATGKIAIRVDLRDFAVWLSGVDPFADERAGPDTQPPTGTPRPAASVEAFLVDLLRHISGGQSLSVSDLARALHGYPMLLVLDGLDEVADPERRRAVVGHIEAFAARTGPGAPTQIVVTTRPNASGLPEPALDGAQRLSLQPLPAALRESYLHKWATARGLDEGDREDLARIFHERTAEPHVMQLADNPMQLTILLYLIGRTHRTDAAVQLLHGHAPGSGGGQGPGGENPPGHA